MTTIKLIPSVMEFDVSLDSASMPSLFSQSLETSIVEEVTRQVEGRIPNHETVVDDVAVRLSEDRAFSRKIRDWVSESMDYQSIVRDVRDSIEMSEVIENLQETWDSENFMRAMLNNARFRNLVQQCTAQVYDQNYMVSVIEERINSMSANFANDIAEKVLKVIQNRLTLGSDV